MKKQNRQLLTIALLAGASYYFFLYLPKKRSKAIQEIKTELQNNPNEMKKEIKQKATVSQGKSIEELRKEVINNIENFAQREIKFNSLLEKDLKKFCKRIKQAPNEDIFVIEQEAISFITEQKHRRQGLH
ncbi:12605_t:CDS:2 [Funneliformis geosporum]|nr:12605_t:CDS:2 [Funneliformis geosporum]